MKRILTLSLLFVVALIANAQETEYKKTWDFTKGFSAETKANLNEDENWVSNRTDATTGETTGWKDNKKMSGTLKANGVEIAELKDLVFGTAGLGNNSNYLLDPTSIRISRANMEVSFPKLKNGQKITIIGRSANKTATNRGIAPVQSHLKFQADLSSSQTDGKCIFLGSDAAGSEGEYTFVWKVETESEDAVDVTFKLTPSGGIDFTLFQIDDGDAPAVEEAKKVAFLGTDEDFALGMFDAGVVNPTVVAAVPTLDELQENYDALVIGTTATEEQLQGVKNILAFFPIVNSNPALYATLSLGSAAEAANPTLTFTDASLTEDETLEAAAVSALTLGEYFANDAVLAKAGDEVAIHVHNAKRNAYYFIPTDDATEGLYTILSNAIVAASKTKKPVAAVGTPNITFTQSDGKSTVTITASNSKAIYYTVDGSAPTAESTNYTEPFDVTENVTVKAFATGDGYTDSQVGEKEILIATQIAKPQIQVAREAGKSTITLTAEEGADIYFNFNGAKTAALSQKYTAPIELTEPAYIYLLATKENYLPSELGKEFVGIDGVNGQNIRMDIYAHMDANQADWFVDNSANGGTGSASAYYYWGNKAWNYYSEPEVINPEALKTVNPTTENGWILKSEGQVLTGELQLAPGDGVGNGATGRYAEEAIDFLPAGLENSITKGVITFGAKADGEPYTARIESTGKFAGPFDVVVFCGNGNNSSKGVLEIQTSADGTTWTKLAELNLANTQRYIKRTKASYDAAEEVFVRVAQTGGGTKAQVYDIYILNSGEKSAAYSEEATGIKNVKKAIKAAAGIYDVNGVRRQALGRGLNIVIDEQGRAKKVVK